MVEHRVQATERKRKASQLTMLSTTKAMLKEFHRHLNEKLADLLQDNKFTWPEMDTVSDTEGGLGKQKVFSLLSDGSLQYTELHDELHKNRLRYLKGGANFKTSGEFRQQFRLAKCYSQCHKMGS